MHVAIDDDAAACPWALWFASTCELFPGRLPTEIWQEIQRLPVGFFDEIVEAMLYARAKRLYDATVKKSDLPADPMLDLVRTVTFGLAEDELVKRRQGKEDDGSDE